MSAQLPASVRDLVDRYAHSETVSVPESKEFRHARDSNQPTNGIAITTMFDYKAYFPLRVAQVRYPRHLSLIFLFYATGHSAIKRRRECVSREQARLSRFHDKDVHSLASLVSARMTITKFLHFCNDFDIYPRLASRGEVLRVFKVVTNYFRSSADFKHPLPADINNTIRQNVWARPPTARNGQPAAPFGTGGLDGTTTITPASGSDSETDLNRWAQSTYPSTGASFPQFLHCLALLAIKLHTVIAPNAQGAITLTDKVKLFARYVLHLHEPEKVKLRLKCLQELSRVRNMKMLFTHRTFEVDEYGCGWKSSGGVYAARAPSRQSQKISKNAASDPYSLHLPLSEKPRGQRKDRGNGKHDVWRRQLAQRINTLHRVAKKKKKHRKVRISSPLARKKPEREAPRPTGFVPHENPYTRMPSSPIDPPSGFKFARARKGPGPHRRSIVNVVKEANSLIAYDRRDNVQFDGKSNDAANDEMRPQSAAISRLGNDSPFNAPTEIAEFEHSHYVTEEPPASSVNWSTLRVRPKTALTSTESKSIREQMQSQVNVEQRYRSTLALMKQCSDQVALYISCLAEEQAQFDIDLQRMCSTAKGRREMRDKRDQIMGVSGLSVDDIIKGVRMFAVLDAPKPKPEWVAYDAIDVDWMSTYLERSRSFTRNRAGHQRQHKATSPRRFDRHVRRLQQRSIANAPVLGGDGRPLSESLRGNRTPRDAGIDLPSDEGPAAYINMGRISTAKVYADKHVRRYCSGAKAFLDHSQQKLRNMRATVELKSASSRKTSTDRGTEHLESALRHARYRYKIQVLNTGRSLRYVTAELSPEVRSICTLKYVPKELPSGCSTTLMLVLTPDVNDLCLVHRVSGMIRITMSPANPRSSQQPEEALVPVFCELIPHALEARAGSLKEFTGEVRRKVTAVWRSFRARQGEEEEESKSNATHLDKTQQLTTSMSKLDNEINAASQQQRPGTRQGAPSGNTGPRIVWQRESGLPSSFVRVAH